MADYHEWQNGVSQQLGVLIGQVASIADAMQSLTAQGASAVARIDVLEGTVSLHPFTCARLAVVEQDLVQIKAQLSERAATTKASHRALAPLRKWVERIALLVVGWLIHELLKWVKNG